MSDKLRECPFCGNKARLVHNDGFWWCECINEDDCSAVHPVYSRANTAIAAWNRRVPGAGVPVEVREAIAAIAERLNLMNPFALPSAQGIVAAWLDAQAQEGDA